MKAIVMMTQWITNPKNYIRISIWIAHTTRLHQANSTFKIKLESSESDLLTDTRFIAFAQFNQILQSIWVDICWWLRIFKKITIVWTVAAKTNNEKECKDREMFAFAFIW